MGYTKYKRTFSRYAWYVSDTHDAISDRQFMIGLMQGHKKEDSRCI